MNNVEIAVSFLILAGAGIIIISLRLFNKKILKAIKHKYAEALKLNMDLIEEQKDLLASEKKYRSILENIDESYFEVDLQGNLMFFNDSTCRILGYQREELMGINYLAYLAKEGTPHVLDVYQRLHAKKIRSGFCRIRYYYKKWYKKVS